MPMQKIEFEFPDGDDTEIELEPSSAKTINLKDPNSHLEDDKPEPEAKKESKVDDDDDIDLEIVDDTPKADRGRKPSDPPEDPTEDELENYSEKVRNRIKHFTKGYHDERRAKEAAERERQELQRVAQRLMEENKTLKQSGSQSREALLNQAKANADQSYQQAKQAYKAAYNDGDSDKVLEAQEKLTDAKLRVEKLANYKLPPLQTDDDSVNNNYNSEPVNTNAQQPQQKVVDKRAEKWAEENGWFQTDVEMTGYALGLHNKLVQDGVDPTSDEYYETLNTRMRKVFPDRFDEPEAPESRQAKTNNVVAPATRSTTPKKVRLTQTQVSIAKALGLTPEQYAKQVAIEMRKK